MPGIAGLQFGDRVADGGGIDFDEFFVVGQFAERSGDSYFFAINLISALTVDRFSFRVEQALRIRAGSA